MIGGGRASLAPSLHPYSPNLLDCGVAFTAVVNIFGLPIYHFRLQAGAHLAGIVSKKFPCGKLTGHRES